MEILGLDSKRFVEKGITLIEGLISTVIVGIGFIAVFQMVNYSVQSIDVSGERTKGTYLVSMVAEDLMGNSQAEKSSQKFVDILVNNTQGPKSGDIESLLIQDYQNAFDLLFKSFVFTTISALPYMKKNNWGRILNMVSISVKEPLSYLALSNSIRGSVVTWAKTLANDVADCNITVNNILTGYFQTERIEELNLEKAKKLDVPINQIYESMKNQVPMKRIGQPEEFAYLASFLCSDKANYITGINIPIDGGLIKSL